jgi:hypothetical protein
MNAKTRGKHLQTESPKGSIVRVMIVQCREDEFHTRISANRMNLKITIDIKISEMCRVQRSKPGILTLDASYPRGFQLRRGRCKGHSKWVYVEGSTVHSRGWRSRMTK